MSVNPELLAMLVCPKSRGPLELVELPEALRTRLVERYREHFRDEEPVVRQGLLCRDSGLADALSTAVFIMPLAMGQKFVAGLDGVAVMWVMGNGELVYSKGFKSFLKKQ